MPVDPLSQTFAALADPTRRAILARLAEGESSLTELAEPFEITVPAVAKHLKVLEQAGLVRRRRQAQRRPVRLVAAPLMNIDEWLAHYRRFYEATLDRLGEYLRKVQAQPPRRTKRKEKSNGRKKRRSG